MNKIQSMLRSSILPATAFISLFSFTPQAVYPQTISPIAAFLGQVFNKPAGDPEPPIKPVKGVSRPGKALCLISPDAPSQTRVIWNTKPLFIWKGEEVKKIAVGIPGSKEYLGTQIVTRNQTVNYIGKPLEPGQTYEWLIFLSELESASPAMLVPFQVMEAPQRNRITADLRYLERLDQRQGANPETIALTKAKYFAEKGLWSDALQQVYSVPNPSPELSQTTKDLSNQLCKSSSGEHSRNR